MTQALISVVSYNVHRCIGFDRRRRAGRIARILSDLGADIIGLQEVDSRSDGRAESYQMRYLADATGLQAVGGPTMLKENSEYGNVLLSRYPVVNLRHIDLSVPGREPRGAIDAEIAIADKTLRVIVSHLGLGLAERRYQVKRLVELLESSGTCPVFMLMDHNEWLPMSLTLRELNQILGKPRAVRTFPARLPLLGHDRIWVKPSDACVRVQRCLTPLTLIASDHLPIKATIDIGKLFPSG
jgi:endonuclease/exonuclease/phosphatase family metal-dependent hydrolase